MAGRRQFEGTEAEENQRPFEPQEEQQFEPTSVDSPLNQGHQDEISAGKQPSGEPPASAAPLGGS